MAKVNDNFDGRIELRRFLDDLVTRQGYWRKRTYWFDALPWCGRGSTEEDRRRRDKKHRFLDSLAYFPRTEIYRGRVVRRVPTPEGDGSPVYVQKQVDVLLSLKMAEIAFRGDVKFISLIAGDSDFVPAVRLAKNAGVVVTLIFASMKGVLTHNELKREADERIELTPDLIRPYLMRENDDGTVVE